MRKILLFFLVFPFVVFAQVGISTTTPEGILDINSDESGVIFPRVALTSETDALTVINPQGGALVDGTFVYNTGAGGFPEGFYYWKSGSWKQLVDTIAPHTYVGKAIINAAGTVVITGLPFRPRNIRFTAYSNVDAYTLDADNGVGNNNSGIPNVFGGMRGYAYTDGLTIDQQVIFNGGSGNSINDISRYASPNHCVGLRYANQNGNNLGLTTATLLSFDSNGFTLDVDNYADAVVIIYEAYRY